MSVSLVSVLVSQPVLLCVVVLWYVTVFVSSGFWARYWRGLAGCHFCVLNFPTSQYLYCLPFFQLFDNNNNNNNNFNNNNSNNDNKNNNNASARCRYLLHFTGQHCPLGCSWLVLVRWSRDQTLLLGVAVVERLFSSLGMFRVPLRKSSTFSPFPILCSWRTLMF